MASSWRWARFPWRGLFMGLLCAVAASLLFQLRVMQNLEEWALDSCFHYRASRPTQANIVLIGLDEDSLQELHRPLAAASPELAELVTYANAQGARAIGLDIIVPEYLAGLAVLDRDAEGDATRLGHAIDKAQNVVLPQWNVSGRTRQPLPAWLWKHFQHPEPTDLGFVDLVEDDDQFIRRQVLYAKTNDEPVMQFAMALYARATGSKVHWDGQKLWLGEDAVPLEADQTLRINYVGPSGSFRTLPFRDALKHAMQNDSLPDLRNAVVLIGVTAPSQHDYHATPYAHKSWSRLFGQESALTSGVEIHAHIYATLFDRAFIRTQAWVSSWPMLLALGAVLGIGFETLNRIRGTLAFFLAACAFFLAHHFGWKYFCFLVFTHLNWRIEMLAMLFLGLFTFAANFAIRWLSTRRVLGTLKSRSMVGLLDQGGSLGLPGEERVVTVLFADIRDFTKYSENHSAQEVVALLNAYYGEVVPVIEKHGGLLNQYMGDGIMVLFGAPAVTQEHALQGVRAAVAMVRRVHQLQTLWAQHDCPDFRIGAGIHTGAVVVGTVGAPSRHDYTAMGDVVNAAARIEAENKGHDTEILISEETYRALPREERPRLGCDPESFPVQVKGKLSVLRLHAARIS